MNPLQFVAVRVGLRRVAAGCDRDFDRARGVPRQHDIRLRLEIQRMQRNTAAELDGLSRRATPGSDT